MIRTGARGIGAAAVIAATCVSGVARADGPLDAPLPERAAPSAMSDAPIVAYTYQATGASAGSYGASAYGLGAGAQGGVGYAGTKKGVVGGGLTVWAAPIDRLTLVGDAARDATGNFAPSAALVARVLGRADDGFSLGVLGKFKVEGFGVGPNDEMESEIEGGLLLSYAKQRWHFDLNAISGFGTGDDGEKDAEGRLRIGRDLGQHVRLGIDGQARYRMAGSTLLVGGRRGDFTAGPQLMIGSGHLFGALTAGPTTTNVFEGFGFGAIATIGGTTL